MYDIALIGLGATGVSLLTQLHSQLYEQDITSLHVAVISPAEGFGAGVAFGGAEAFHKVNTPPELMSIDPEDPRGFSARMRQQEVSSEKYPARLTYSQYLRFVYGSLSGDRKLKIAEYHGLAIDLEVSQKSQVVHLDDGRRVLARRVVLAMGSVSAPTFGPDSCISPRAVSEIPCRANVLVAGTGLTAVDCVRSLARNGCSSIHMFSRNGFAPTVVSTAVNYEPEYFTWHNLKHVLSRHARGNRLPSVIRLLREEVRHMDDPEVFQAGRLLGRGDLCGYWEYLLDRSANGSLPFQDTLGSTRYFAHKIWRKLGEEERVSFQRSFGAFWATWRHPVPVEVVQELYQLVREGRLQLHRPIAPIKRTGRHYVLETERGTVMTEALIDGTGGSANMEKAESLLVRNLLRRGLAKAHPCGGLRVDTLTYAVINDREHTNLYCLGPLAKGALFSTNAFWFNANCASNLAQYFAIEMRIRWSLEGTHQ
ncbi:MAG: hypothetical protein CL583_01270 [Alteromonadaceae bacterium]|nr:hypothetical protein [Alteromonadaceae bacterium]|tara:strand:- start:1525 stop:2967 length:1443 start_codon:yes stop_codon:yes gene_type:complete